MIELLLARDEMAGNRVVQKREITRRSLEVKTKTLEGELVMT